MPWIPGYKDERAVYRLPIFSDDVLGAIDLAKVWRKHWGHTRDLMLQYQKECAARIKDDKPRKWWQILLFWRRKRCSNRELAKFFSEEASEALKQYRGWDCAIKWIDGDKSMNWPATEKLSEEIAPYVDRTFSFLDYKLLPLEQS